jgi:hypothetical protein
MKQGRALGVFVVVPVYWGRWNYYGCTKSGVQRIPLGRRGAADRLRNVLWRFSSLDCQGISWAQRVLGSSHRHAVRVHAVELYLSRMKSAIPA